MIKFKNTILLLCCSAVACILFSCANIVAPSGGPQDMKPPVNTGSNPANRTTGFTSKRIILEFDEFISLNDAEQIVVSPLLKEKPDFRTRGKKLLIDFRELPNDSLTYTIYFGNAIQDITENNKLTGFTYSFSPAGHIDSMSISGNVKNAFTLEPEKNVFVFLYNVASDSIPLRTLPLFLTKTDESGNFRFSNLPHGSFSLTALKDGNSNLIFDQPSEMIAFYSEVIASEYIAPPKPPLTDTTLKTAKKDTIPSIPDSSLNKNQNMQYALRMFAEKDTALKINKFSSTQYGLVQIIFNLPAAELKLTPLNISENTKWLQEWSRKSDTLHLWLYGQTPDTVSLALYTAEGFSDTIFVQMKKKPASGHEKTAKGTTGASVGFSLGWTANTNTQQTLPHFNPLIIRFRHPISSYNFDAIRIREAKDSVSPGLAVKPYWEDSLIKRSLVIPVQWSEGVNYDLHIDNMSFTDIFDLASDTIDINFKTSSSKDYGILILNLTTNYSSQLLIQLTQNNNIIEQLIVSGPGKYRFENLLPGEYKIKVISDSNKNGEWDSGSLFSHTQAETIYVLPDAINVKANWDTEIDATISDTSIH